MNAKCGKNKNSLPPTVRLTNAGKIDRAKKILNARTETEVLEKALDKVLQEHDKKLRLRKIVKSMDRLRETLGPMGEDPTEWIRRSREERNP
jgi:hypothetical protein